VRVLLPNFFHVNEIVRLPTLQLSLDDRPHPSGPPPL